MLHIHTDIGCDTVENTDMKKEPEFHTCSGGTNPCENTKYHVVCDVAKLSDGKTEVGLIDNDYYQDTYRQYTRGMCSNRNYIDTGMIRDIHVDPVKSEPADEPLETNDQNKFIIEVDTCKDEYYETHGYPNSNASVSLEESVEPGSDRYCVMKERMEHTHIHRGRCTLHTSPNTKPCTVLLSDIRYKYPDIVIEGTVRVRDVDQSMKIHTPSIQRIHTLQQQKQKEYPCSVCGVAFTCKCSLKVNATVHTGEKPHKCSVCNASFAGKWNLTRHIRTHTGEKPHKCTICGVNFSEKGNLTSHERIHTGVKPYKCSVCGVGFRQKGYMDTHMVKHTGEKPHTCSVCDISFSQKNSLTRHMRTHTGEKPYKCTVCGVGFAHAAGLKYHTTTHTGTMSYVCTCGVGFAMKSHLNAHLRTHRCPVCGAAFGQESDLTTHTRIHINEYT